MVYSILELDAKQGKRNQAANLKYVGKSDLTSRIDDRMGGRGLVPQRTTVRLGFCGRLSKWYYKQALHKFICI
jgi:hypothetical protein